MNALSKYSLILACASIFILCDSIAAVWSKTGNHRLLYIFLLAPIGYYFFGVINKSTTLSVSSGLVNAIVIIVTICIGVFVFNDQLNARQALGLIFAVSAVFLLY